MTIFFGFWPARMRTISSIDKTSASISADGVKLYLYPSADAPTLYHYGPAWIDASMSTSVNGAVAISGTFAANGTWDDNGISA